MWRACLAIALCLAARTFSAAEPIRIVESRTFAVETLLATLKISHELDLHLYTFSGTRWKSEAIVAASRAAVKLLAQCGLAASGLTLHTVEAPRRFHFYATPVSRELARTIDLRRPAVVFAEDTRNEPAFDAEAIGLRNADTRPELANTVWVAYGARDLALVLAHELVHVLSDSGEHSREPHNLMQSETAWQNAALTPQQCDRLRERGSANGLLRAR